MDIASLIIILFAGYVAVFGVVLWLIFGGFVYGAMYMRLPKKRVQRMLELGNVSKGKVVYDLGAGYGNIGFQAAELGASVIAVEADWFKAWWIRWQIKRKQLTNMVCFKRNLLDIDLSNADTLLCYLSDSLMDKISGKHLKAGSVIISAGHKIKGWKPKVVDKDGITRIYAY